MSCVWVTALRAVPETSPSLQSPEAGQRES